MRYAYTLGESGLTRISFCYPSLKTQWKKILNFLCCPEPPENNSCWGKGLLWCGPPTRGRVMWLPQLKMKDPNFSALRTDTLIPKTLLSKLPSISSLKPWGKVSEIRRRHVSSPLILSRSPGWRRIERDAGGLVEVSPSEFCLYSLLASRFPYFLFPSLLALFFFLPLGFPLLGSWYANGHRVVLWANADMSAKGPFRTGSLKRK